MRACLPLLALVIAAAPLTASAGPTKPKAAAKAEKPAASKPAAPGKAVAVFTLGGASAVTSVPKNKLRDGVVTIDLGGKPLEAIVPGAKKSAKAHGLGLRLRVERAGAGAPDAIEDILPVDGPDRLRGTLVSLFPKHSGEFTKFASFVMKLQAGDTLVLETSYLQLQPTGQVVQDNGNLVPEHRWDRVGPEILAAARIQILASDVPVPSNEVVLALLQARLAKFDAEYPELRTDPSFTNDLRGYVEAAARERAKKNPSEFQAMTMSSGLFPAGQPKFKASDVAIDGEPECGASPRAGKTACRWKLKARFDAGLAVEKDKKWSTILIPLACEWKVDGEVDDATKTVEAPARDWYAIRCKALP
jgi:hypothetical protein